MDNDDPFADIDSATPKSKKSENRAILRDARKKASVDLYQEFDDPELDLIRKTANPYVFIASFGVFILAMIFGLKPISFIATGQGEYAVQVNIAIIDNDLVQSECRPVGKNKALENSTVVLSGIPGSSDISLTEKLAFADATLIENADNSVIKQEKIKTDAFLRQNPNQMILLRTFLNDSYFIKNERCIAKY